MPPDTAQRPSVRVARFSEIMSPLTEKNHIQEGQAAATEAKMELLTQLMSNNSLNTQKQTPSGSRQDEVVARQPTEIVKSPVIKNGVIAIAIVKSPAPNRCGTLTTKTPIKSPVKTSSGKSDSHATASSSKPPQGKRQVDSRSKLPSLNSTMTRDDLDISFASIPLRPEMRPICTNRKGRKCAHVPKDELDRCPIFICQGCNNRPICRACIPSTLANERDKHQAEHYMRQWEPEVSVQFEKFLWERRHGAKLYFGPRELLGREWLYSDHSFAPSSTGNLTVRFSVYPEPGKYRISVGVRTYVSSSSISKDTLGKSNHAIITSGTTWIGSLGVGVRTMDRDAPTPNKAVNASLGRLPEKITEVKITPGFQNEEHISPPEIVEVSADQAIEVSIRHWHDKSVFRKRSPFKWWLDSIVVTPAVATEQLSL